jgi:predicted transcriptional regulator
MGRALPNVTDAEWAVLRLLWERGPSPVRGLAEVLYPGGGPSEYATVHRLLERLEGKGYVKRERTEGVYHFRAAVEQDEAVGRQVEALVDRLCGGSLQPLLTGLVRVKRLTAEELRELLALVEDEAARGRAKKKKRE